MKSRSCYAQQSRLASRHTTTFPATPDGFVDSTGIHEGDRVGEVRRPAGSLKAAAAPALQNALLHNIRLLFECTFPRSLHLVALPSPCYYPFRYWT